MAYPTVVGVGTPAGSAAGVTPTKHASATTGDDNWLAVEANSNQLPATITDWTLVDSSSSAGAGSTGLAVWHQKEAGQGDPTIADVGNHLYAVILTTRGGDATTPVNDSANDREEVADTSGSAPSITTSVAECLVVDFVCTSLDSTTPAWADWANASLDLTGLGELFEGGTDAGSGGGIAIHAGKKATAGAVSATTMTTPNEHKAFVKIAIAPASSGTAHSLAGSIAGDSSSTGALKRGVLMAGVANGAASVTGAIGLGFELAGAANGTSSVTGDIGLGFFLAGAADGVATVDGALTVTVGGTSHSLAGAADGTSVITGAIGLGFDLQGVVVGDSSVTGALIQGHILAGESTGTSTVTGYMTNEWLLAGSSAGDSSVTGNLFQLIAGAQAASTTNFAPIYFLLRRKRR